jgi:hypothetical protein
MNPLAAGRSFLPRLSGATFLFAVVTPERPGTGAKTGDSLKWFDADEE